MRFCPGRQRDEQGQVAIIVALTLTLMLAFGALVVDVGLNWAVRGQAQSAADAAALAGAALLPADPPGAVDVVKAYLDSNVPGLSTSPADPQWASNGVDADGEVICYAPPAQPVPGDGCPAGAFATAIQVITPPIEPTYAFASILGHSSNSVKALASAGATPSAVAPCALCVLGTANPALTMSGPDNGSITVKNGGVVVNADSDIGNGTLTATSIDVVGEARPITPGSYTPPANEGAAPVADPFSALPTPAQLVPPTLQNGNGGGTVFRPGVYNSININTPGVRFLPGVYVIKSGMTISAGSVQALNVVLYFGCNSYPAPCNGTGAGLSVTGTGRLQLTAATTGGPVPAVYRNLAIFFDRSNTASIDLGGTSVGVTGTTYARSGLLRLHGLGWTLNSMVAVGTMDVVGNGQDTIDFSQDQNVAIQTGSGGLIQ